MVKKKKLSKKPFQKFIKEEKKLLKKISKFVTNDRKKKFLKALVVEGGTVAAVIGASAIAPEVLPFIPIAAPIIEASATSLKILKKSDFR